MRNSKILEVLLELNGAVNLIDSQFVKLTKLFNNLDELKIDVSKSEKEIFLESLSNFNKFKSYNREFLKEEIAKLKKNVI